MERSCFRREANLTEEIPEALANDLQLQGTLSDENVIETENPYRITVPLGEVGSVVLNVDRSEVAERVAGLRGDLLSQTIGIAVLTFGTLLLAFAFVWFLIQRTRRLEAQRFEAEEMAALGCAGGESRARDPQPIEFDQPQSRVARRRSFG